MKAYIAKCTKCDTVTDRIVRDVEEIYCGNAECHGAMMIKQGGPIGGNNVMPLGIRDKDRFIPYKSPSLRKRIESHADMVKFYQETNVEAPDPYSVRPPVVEEEESEDSDEEEVEVKKPRGGRGRRVAVKKVDSEDDEDADL